MSCRRLLLMPFVLLLLGAAGWLLHRYVSFLRPVERYNQGGAAFRAGRHDEAIRKFREAMAMKEDFGEASLFLAQALVRVHRFDEAARQCARALALFEAGFFVPTEGQTPDQKLRLARETLEVIAIVRLAASAPETGKEGRKPGNQTEKKREVRKPVQRGPGKWPRREGTLPGERRP